MSTYPGGKGGAGVYQKLINLMPPHDVYIETHLGGGALFRHKRPARVNIGIDLDAEVIAAWESISGTCISNDKILHPIVANDDDGRDVVIDNNNDAAAMNLVQGDAVAFLESYPFTGNELVYSDPPYLMETRKSGPIYRYEYTEQDHKSLLACLKKLSCRVMISGYWSEMYAQALSEWNNTSFQAMTRGGTMATEWVWFNFPHPASGTLCPTLQTMMTPERLAEIGAARHGNRWKAPLAREIGVERKTVTRWAQGKVRIPQDTTIALESLPRLPTGSLHDDRYLGENYRERERIKRKKDRWVKRLQTMPVLERRALMAAIAEAWPQLAPSEISISAGIVTSGDAIPSL